MITKNRRNILVGSALLLFVACLAYTFLSQPGPDRLTGGFTEVVATRNENNTGPVIRLYAVEVQDPLTAAYKLYGDFMPHTKYGKTTVYFFLPHQAPRLLQVDEPHFDTLRYNPIAVYSKNSRGNVRLQQHGTGMFR